MYKLFKIKDKHKINFLWLYLSLLFSTLYILRSQITILPIPFIPMDNDAALYITLMLTPLLNTLIIYLFIRFSYKIIASYYMSIAIRNQNPNFMMPFDYATLRQYLYNFAIFSALIVGVFRLIYFFDNTFFALIEAVMPVGVFLFMFLLYRRFIKKEYEKPISNILIFAIIPFSVLYIILILGVI